MAGRPVARVNIDRVGVGDVGPGNQGVVITTSLSRTVTFQGQAAVVVGSPVPSHGKGSHVASVMVTGSSTVTVEGKPICRHLDSASCGHVINVINQGKSTVNVG